MTPWKSISSCFRNCVNFSGRATASEFWWFTLFALVMLIFPVYSHLNILALAGGSCKTVT